MIEQKENDWIVNILGNQHLSTADFKEAGLNAENTSLLDEEVYKRSSLITENPLFKNDNGDFDDTKFHDFYEQASFMYNMLANDTYLDKMAELQTIYGKDDIFAPKELRRTFEDTVKYTRVHNADRTTTGLVRIGETSAPKLSRDEIAQTLKVLANPIEAEKDPSKAVWHDSPNDSWFTDFFDTRVMAAWDSDGEHQDLITGEIVKHKKGDYKLNENGTYYYENLDSRDVYGKHVLNKMNTLTTDGSTLNKYDFFDSDGLELKSIGGSIIKNAALVGSMFIPYVGPWIAGLSVASQLAGLYGTFGKMFTGSDSPTLSALEGWSKSVNRQNAKSQYAQENTWCWENFINLIGDVMGLLVELRFLFEYAPAIIKGTKATGWNGISLTKQAKFAEELALKYKALNEAKWENLKAVRKAAGKGITASEVQSYSALRSAETLMGSKDVENFMKSYLNIGEILSKGYMTAITVGDTYGEAKYEGGASDIEATLLTLGYAALEYKLLSTGIGEWILPELKNSGLKNRAIIKALTKVPEHMRISAKNKVANKKELAKYWFNKGKEIATNVSLAGKGLGGLIVSAGLGESVEEVSEELLADVSKSCYNVVQWLLGEDNRMSAWKNMSDRYLMSFIGGAVGGGLTAAGTNFKIYNLQLTPEQAVQELVYIIRENKENELYKSLDKMTIANPYLLNELTLSADEKSMIFKPATSESSNMDLDVKKAFKLNIKLLKDIINSEGLRISDLTFLDLLTFNDIRLAKLQESPIAALYLLDFNTLSTKIVGIRDKINEIMSRKTDSGEFSADDLELLNALNKELLNLRNRKNQYLNGELAMDYIGKALFSLTPIFSKYYHYSFFKDYVKHKYNKELSELSESDLKDYREEFEIWKNTDHKNDVSVLAPLYLEMARKSGMFIQEFAKNYDNIRKNTTLLNLINSRLRELEVMNMLGVDLDTNKVRKDTDLNEWINSLSKVYTQESANTELSLIYSYGNDRIKNSVNAITKLVKALDLNSSTYKLDFTRLSTLLTDLISLEIAKNVDTYFNEFITTGVINPEILHSLQLVLENSKSWVKNLETAIQYSPSANEMLELLPDYNFNENTTLLELKESVNNWDKDEIADGFDELLDLVIEIYNRLGLPTKAPELITLRDYDLVKQSLKDLSSKLDLKISTINSLTYTDTVSFILNYIQTNSDSKLDIAKLLESVNSILDLNMTNLEGANLDILIDQINEGVEVIGWLQGLVLGALVDSDANLDNLIGYNVTMNEIAKNNHVKDYIPLPTITKDDALIIDLDLELIKNKLVLAKAIYAINQEKKFILLDSVAINKSYINYNRLKKFIINIGDDWKEKDKLAEALENAEVLKAHAETRDLRTLTEKDKELLEKERASIEDAIFNFFNNSENIKKIQNGELYTLFQKGFDLYSSTSQLINAETELLDDRNFLWYLATRAAIKHSGFYNEFKQIINDEVAPIPTLEESVFLNIAFILNGDIVNSFKEAYIKAALDNFKNSSETEKRRILKDNFEIADYNSQTEIIATDDLINLLLFPIYSNIYLTEGVPGAGKSKAVDYYTVLFLKKNNHSEILRKVWIAHNTKSKAEELSKALDITVDSTYDKNSLMSAIYSNYNTGRLKDTNGNYLYEDSEWIKDPKNNQIIYKYKSDDIAKENIPSLIIIDEVSHYDLADLMLLDDFAKKNGIPIITSGDFDQSSVTAESENWEGVGLILTSERSNFMHSPKLGISMRTANSQMDKTTTSFRSGDSKIKSYYYLDNLIGLNGVKLIPSSRIDLIEKDIKLMIATTANKEKIGLIYYDENSDIVKLVNEKFKDNFELFLGSSALGGEGQYYVVDVLGSSKNEKELKKDLYTAITRASLGVLLIGQIVGIDLLNILETVTTDASYSKSGLLNYSNKRKKLFESIYTTNDKLTYIPRKTVNTATTSKPPVVPPIVPPIVPPPSNFTWVSPVKSINIEGIEYLTDGVKVAKKVKDTLEELASDNPITKKVLEIYNNLSAEPPENTLLDETSKETLNRVEALNMGLSENPISKKSAVEETPSGTFDFTYLLHSHNTFELGIRDNNDKIEFFDSDLSRYLHRIDSVIGLMKIFEKDWKNPTRSVSFYTNVIKNLRGYLFNISDKSNLLLALNSEFNPNEDNNDLNVVSLEFGLISSPNISERNIEQGLKWGYGLNAKEFGIFDKSVDEKTIGNANPDPDSKNINRKSINAIITLNNGKRIALPLFVLGNLETYTRNPQNAVALKLAEIYERVNHNSYQFHKAVLEDPDLQKIPEIYNLARLYLFTNAGYFKIDDNTWTPAKDLKNWGIQINTLAISGEKFPYVGLPKPIQSFIKDSGFIFSKQIYTSQLQLVDSSNNVYDFANIGHAFILVSQDPRINTDKKMQLQYEKLLLDTSILKTVTLVYIAAPKIPIRDYLYNLFELVNEKDPNKRINIKKLGSHLTSYYIWKSILPELKSGVFSNKLDLKTKEHLISVIERLNGISDKRQLLNEIMSNQSWEGVNTGVIEQSVYKHLNYALLSLFTDMNGTIIQENFDNLVQAIENTGLDGIYYSTKFKNKVPPKDLIMVPLESDLSAEGNSLYSINGLPFTINAKLDSNLFSSKELNPIIESFVNKIVAPTNKNPRETSKDTWNFIHPNKKPTTNSSNIKTISLEENSLGLTELKIKLLDGIITINGKSRKLEDTESSIVNEDYYVPLSKEGIKSILQRTFGPLYNERYVDYFYNRQIELLSENEPSVLNLFNKEIYNYHLSNLMLDYNRLSSDGKVFMNSKGNVVLVIFNDLAKFGINEFIINDALNKLVFNNEGIAEYLYDNNTIIRFNEKTKSAEIVRLGQQDTGNEKWDNVTFTTDSPLYKLFVAIGAEDSYMDILNGGYLNEGEPLSLLKGNMDIVEEWTDLLTNLDKNDPNYLELKDLLNYLAEDAEYCTRILKSI